jgi:hypothetical protein
VSVVGPFIVILGPFIVVVGPFVTGGVVAVGRSSVVVGLLVGVVGIVVSAVVRTGVVLIVVSGIVVVTGWNGKPGLNCTNLGFSHILLELLALAVGLAALCPALILCRPKLQEGRRAKRLACNWSCWYRLVQLSFNPLQKVMK